MNRNLTLVDTLFNYQKYLPVTRTTKAKRQGSTFRNFPTAMNYIDLDLCSHFSRCRGSIWWTLKSGWCLGISNMVSVVLSSDSLIQWSPDHIINTWSAYSSSGAPSHALSLLSNATPPFSKYHCALHFPSVEWNPSSQVLPHSLYTVLF